MIAFFITGLLLGRTCGVDRLLWGLEWCVQGLLKGLELIFACLGGGLEMDVVSLLDLLDFFKQGPFCLRFGKTLEALDFLVFGVDDAKAFDAAFFVELPFGLAVFSLTDAFTSWLEQDLFKNSFVLSGHPDVLVHMIVILGVGEPPLLGW